MIICEPVCEGLEHAPFNSQIINQLLKSKPNECVTLLCCQSHWEGVKQSISVDAINRVSHIPIQKLNCKTQVLQWFSQLFFLLRIRKYSELNERWVFLTTTVPIYWWLCHFFKRHKPTVIFHSVLAEVEGWIPRNPIRRFFSLNKTFELFSKKSPKIVVLETYIKNNLTSKFPLLDSKVMVIPHPLPSDVITKRASIKMSSPIRIGFSGGFSSNKGAEIYRKLASKFQGRVEFVVIGKNYLPYDISLLKADFHEGPYEGFLTREEYSIAIESCDFVFLCQSDEHYKWTASGVILDVLHFQKPIIALRSANLAEITKDKWDLGHFFSSFDELVAIVENITHESNLTPPEVQRNLAHRKKVRLSEYMQAIDKL